MNESYKQLLIDLFADPQLMARFKEDPKAVLKERGEAVPDDVEIKVVEDTANLRHFVIPYLGTETPSSVEELEQRATKYWIIA